MIALTKEKSDMNDKLERFTPEYSFETGKWWIAENWIENGKVLGQSCFDDDLEFDDEEAAVLYCKSLNKSVK